MENKKDDKQPNAPISEALFIDKQQRLVKHDPFIGRENKIIYGETGTGASFARQIREVCLFFKA